MAEEENSFSRDLLCSIDLVIGCNLKLGRILIIVLVLSSEEFLSSHFRARALSLIKYSYWSCFLHIILDLNRE